MTTSFRRDMVAAFVYRRPASRVGVRAGRTIFAFGAAVAALMSLAQPEAKAQSPVQAGEMSVTTTDR